MATVLTIRPVAVRLYCGTPLCADLGQPGWNDIVADGHGHIYVNRAGFNPVAGEAFQPGSVYRASADGPARQVTDDIAFPNGMAVTADNSTLIVADSYRRQLVGLAIAADGGLSHRRVWADLGEGTPDGICAGAQAPCGTPTCRTGGACGSPRAALCWAPWTWTAAALPAPSAAPAGPRPQPDHGPGRTTLFSTAAGWRGMTETDMVTAGSGQVLTTEVSVPGAGWP